MQKTTVYRIEQATNGYGMYFGHKSLYTIAEELTGDCLYTEFARHPSPEDDSVLMSSGIPRNTWGMGEISHLVFGLATEAQLRNWLYKDAWLLGLHEAGYVLAIIESEEVYVGSTQAVFLRPDDYKKVSIKEHFNL